MLRNSDLCNNNFHSNEMNLIFTIDANDLLSICSLLAIIKKTENSVTNTENR